jgi:hypothetical protein
MSDFSLQVLRARRWIPFAVLLLVFIAAQIAVVLGGALGGCCSASDSSVTC